MSKEKLTEQAMKYLQKGDLKNAAKTFEKIVKEHSADERTLQKLGDLYARLGEVKPALENYSRVSEIYLKNGFHIKALAVFKQMILLDPDNVALQLRLADMYQAQGLMGEAIGEYHSVLQKAQAQGDVNEELNVLRRLVNLEPSNLVTRVRLAEGMLNNGMVDQGMQEYLETLTFLRNANKMEDYIRVLARYLQHRPDDLARGRELAQLYLGKGEVKKGLTFLQSVLKSDPENLETLLLLAESFLQLKQYKKTVTVYKEMAQVIKRDGDVRRLQWVYERILELDSEDTEARLGLEQLPTQSQILQLVKEQSSASSVPELEDVEQIEVDLEEPDDIEIPNFSEAAASGAYAVINPASSGHIPRPLNEPAPLPTSVPEASSPSGSGYVTIVPRPNESGATPAGFAKLMTEAEVFIKYGLHSQAEGRLRDILEQDPDNLQALELLRNVYLALGSAQDAHLMLMHICLAHLLKDDVKEASLILQEAVELKHDAAMARRFMEKLKFGDKKSVLTELQGMIHAEPDFDADLAEPEMEEPIFDEDDLPEAAMTQAGFDDEMDIEPPQAAENEELEIFVDEVVVDLDSGVHAAAEALPDVLVEEVAFDDLVIEPEIADVSTQDSDDEGMTDDEIEDGLEEADFFIQQGLFEEALEILEDLNIARPGREDIVALLEKCHTGMHDQEAPKTLVSETQVPFEKVEEPVPPPKPANLAKPPAEPTLQGFPVAEPPTSSVATKPPVFAKPVASGASQSGERKLPPPLPGKPPLEPPASGQSSQLKITPPPLPGKAAPALPKKPAPRVRTVNLAEEILADLGDEPENQDSQTDGWMADALKQSPAKKASSSAVLPADHNGGEDLRHLNLGRSYREMGKPTEAINELQHCTSEETRYEALALMAACYIEKDVGLKAAQHLREALALPGLTQWKMKALRMLLAEAYERREDLSEALYFYKSVVSLDPAFNEVAAKADQLVRDGVEDGIDVDDLEDVLRGVNYQALPVGDATASTVPPASNKNNISYV